MSEAGSMSGSHFGIGSELEFKLDLLSIVFGKNRYLHKYIFVFQMYSSSTTVIFEKRFDPSAISASPLTSHNSGA